MPLLFAPLLKLNRAPTDVGRGTGSLAAWAIRTHVIYIKSGIVLH